LLELIDGRAQSITIEPIGDIGIGVEFAVERKIARNGTRPNARRAAAGQLTGWLWEPLMRIYASHENDPAIRKRRLDAVDMLVARNIGGRDRLNEASR